MRMARQQGFSHRAKNASLIVLFLFGIPSLEERLQRASRKTSAGFVDGIDSLNLRGASADVAVTNPKRYSAPEGKSESDRGWPDLQDGI